MKRFCLSIVLSLALSVCSWAETIVIGFTGSGESSTVSSVTVQNLRTGDKVTCKGTEKVCLGTQVSNHKLIAFKQGDALRFTGVSGKMKTIVTQQPTVSHNVNFDFYKCTDKAGFNYTIVRIGDMLWMAEDLRPNPSVNDMVSISNASTAQYLWQSDAKYKMAYSNFDATKTTVGAYYNFEAAKAAMPEGWSLPSMGEMEDFVNSIGGFSQAGIKLKKHNATTWSTPFNEKDTTYFQALPNGYIDKNGALQESGVTACYFTRTLNNGRPVCFSLKLGSSAITMDKAKPLEKTYGCVVRGCRPASSAYSGILSRFNTTTSKTTNQPLANSYQFKAGQQNVFYDISGQNKQSSAFGTASTYASRVGMLDLLNGRSANTKLPNISGIGNRIKKLAAQTNENGYQNIVEVYWDKEPFYNSDSKGWCANSGETSRIPMISGDGNLKLRIYGDATQNYKMVGEEETLAGFRMSPAKRNWAINDQDTYSYIGSGFNQYLKINTFTFDYRDEWFNRQLQVKTVDLTGDGIDEIIVCLSGRIVVYDGKKEPGQERKILAQRSIDRGSDSNYEAHMRFAIGDVDCDGKQDIAIICNDGKSGKYNRTKVRVFLDILGGKFGDSRYGADASYPLSTTAWGDMIDIEIGNVSGSTQPDIITASYDIPTPNLRDLYVLNYTPYTDTKLEKKAYFRTSISYHGTGHSSLVLCGFRGDKYPKDIVYCGWSFRCVKSGDNYSLKYTRLIEDYKGYTPFPEKLIYAVAFTKEVTPGLDTYLKYGNSIIPDGAMIACNADGNKDGRESLFYVAVGHDTEKNSDGNFTGDWHHINRYFSEIKLKSGTTGLSAGDYDRYYDWNKNYLHYNGSSADNMGDAVSQHDYRGDGSNPVLLAVASKHKGMTLKFNKTYRAISDPQIHAVLAASPTVADYDYQSDVDKTTQWGVNKESSSSKGSNSTLKTSASFGFEYEINAPIVGTKLGSVEFETTINTELNNTNETSTSMAYNTTFSVDKADDGVILTAYLYDVYEYTVMSAEDEDIIGTTVNIYIPLEPQTQMIGLTTYNELAADMKGVPNLRQVFNHTVGDPGSYPSSKEALMQMADGGKVLWAAPFNGREFLAVGENGGVSRSIELTNANSSTIEHSYSTELKFSATAGCVKAGFGLELGGGSSISHEEAVGHSVTGTVVGPNYGDFGKFNFEWTLGWYNKTIGGQTFPVVHYVVRNYDNKLGRKKGDVDCSGEVNYNDVKKLVGIVTGKETNNGFADVNKDGTVNIADIAALINLLLGK